MKALKAVILKELTHLFNTPTAYVFAAVFLALNNFFYFNTLFLFEQATLRPFFLNLPLTLIFFVSLLTMGSFAAERKKGTLEVLLSLPLTKATIVLAKFSAIFTFFIFVIALTLSNVFILLNLAQPDLGPIASAYLGTAFLVALYTAVGILISVEAKDQISSFLLTAGILFFFYLLGESFVLDRTPSWLQGIFTFVSPTPHFLNLVKGLVSPRDLIYFLSLTIFFLYLSIKNLSFQQDEFLKIS